MAVGIAKLLLYNIITYMINISWQMSLYKIHDNFQNKCLVITNSITKWNMIFVVSGLSLIEPEPVFLVPLPILFSSHLPPDVLVGFEVCWNYIE